MTMLLLIMVSLILEYSESNIETELAMIIQLLCLFFPEQITPQITKVILTKIDPVISREVY